MAVTLAPPPTVDDVVRELMSLVPRYYHTSRYYRAVIEPESAEFAAMHAALRDILINRMPTLAFDWGLRRWEELLGLPVGPDLSFEARRNAILLALLSVGTPSKPDLIRAIAATFGINAKIYEPHVDVLHLSERGALSVNAHLIDYEYWAPAVIDVTLEGHREELAPWLDANVPAGIRWWMTRHIVAAVELPTITPVQGEASTQWEADVDLHDGVRTSQIGRISDEDRYLSGSYMVSSDRRYHWEAEAHMREFILAGDTSILAGDEEIRAGQISRTEDVHVWSAYRQEED